MALMSARARSLLRFLRPTLPTFRLTVPTSRQVSRVIAHLKANVSALARSARLRVTSTRRPLMS